MEKQTNWLLNWLKITALNTAGNLKYVGKINTSHPKTLYRPLILEMVVQCFICLWVIYILVNVSICNFWNWKTSLMPKQKRATHKFSLWFIYTQALSFPFSAWNSWFLKVTNQLPMNFSGWLVTKRYIL